MADLIVLSLPFLALAAWSGRNWTLALPVVLWVGVAWLESLGILPGSPSPGVALIAGILGAVFAAVGLAAHPRLRQLA